jgi:hypothetical protein
VLPAAGQGFDVPLAGCVNLKRGEDRQFRLIWMAEWAFHLRSRVLDADGFFRNGIGSRLAERCREG